MRRLSADEWLRLQTTIDSGAAWDSPGSGATAYAQIRAGRCKLAPGVLMVFSLGERYEALYSQAEVNKRWTEALGTVARPISAMKRPRWART